MSNIKPAQVAFIEDSKDLLIVMIIISIILFVILPTGIFSSSDKLVMFSKYGSNFECVGSIWARYILYFVIVFPFFISALIACTYRLYKKRNPNRSIAILFVAFILIVPFYLISKSFAKSYLHDALCAHDSSVGSVIAQ